MTTREAAIEAAARAAGAEFFNNDPGRYRAMADYFVRIATELGVHMPNIAVPADRGSFTEDQIKHMVDRFLSWKLPENFNPDGGISFKRTFNEHTAFPMKHEPSGTNLFDATQADAMV